MRILHRNIKGVFLLTHLLALPLLWGQDSTAARAIAAESSISLTAFVETTKTPQNRPVELVVRLQWTGNLDRYEIHPFDNPILENLEISGSGSTNRVTSSNGLATAVRDYTFTLKPQAIGMAYVEAMIIRYTDMATNVDYRLTTNRIPVEITEPVPEPGSKTGLLWLAVLPVVGLVAFLLQRQIKKTAGKKTAQEITEPVVPMEEKFLQELKAAVDLNSPTLDGVKAFSSISRLLRRFLHERFDAPGFEATTAEMYQFLYDKKFDDRLINDVKQVLSNADVIKFSGKYVDRPEVERAYSLVEAILQKSLRREIEPGLAVTNENGV